MLIASQLRRYITLNESDFSLPLGGREEKVYCTVQYEVGFEGSSCVRSVDGRDKGRENGFHRDG
jgi:hypothetical protein